MTDEEKITTLDKDVMKKAETAYRNMNCDGALKILGVEKVAVSEARRELTTQMAYYSRSRMKIEDVKKMYKAAGLYDISDKEAQIANTWTLASNHLSGNAIDFVPMKNGKQWWAAPTEVWKRMGEIGKACGFEWGGDWEEQDFPHFEVKS